VGKVVIVVSDYRGHRIDVQAVPAGDRFKPVALIARPDTEVVTPESTAALAALAESAGIPFCDPAVDHFPDCSHCGWKPEHGPADHGGS
jgi:hypothetical protein